MTDRRERRFLLLAIGVSSLLLCSELPLPFSGDEFLLRSVARDVLQTHQPPFISTIINDLPGAAAIHVLSISLFGESMFGFHVLDILLHVLQMTVFYLLLRRWVSPRTSLIAVILYTLHYISGGIWLIAKKECDEMIFYVFASYSMMRVLENDHLRTRSLYSAIAGSFVGMMVLCHGTAVLFALALFVFAVRFFRVSEVLYFSLGLLTLLLAFVLPIYFGGGMQTMYEAAVLYNTQIFGTLRRTMPDLMLVLRQQKLYLTPAFITIVLFVSPKMRERVARIWASPNEQREQGAFLLTLSIAAGVTSMIIIGKFWPGHLDPVVLTFIPLAAIGYEAILELLPTRRWRIVAIALLCVYYVFRALPIYEVRPFVMNALHRDPNAFAKAQDSVSQPFFPVSLDISAARYVEDHTSANDRYECAASEPGVRALTHRRSASRFPEFGALATASRSGMHPEFQQRWREEYVDSLRVARPRFLLLSSAPCYGYRPPVESIHTIPGFDSLIMPHYRYDTTVGSYILFRRQD